MRKTLLSSLLILAILCTGHPALAGYFAGNFDIEPVKEISRAVPQVYDNELIDYLGRANLDRAKRKYPRLKKLFDASVVLIGKKDLIRGMDELSRLSGESPRQLMVRYTSNYTEFYKFTKGIDSAAKSGIGLYGTVRSFQEFKVYFHVNDTEIGNLVRDNCLGLFRAADFVKISYLELQNETLIGSDAYGYMISRLDKVFSDKGMHDAFLAIPAEMCWGAKRLYRNEERLSKLSRAIGKERFSNALADDPVYFLESSVAIEYWTEDEFKSRVKAIKKLKRMYPELTDMVHDGDDAERASGVLSIGTRAFSTCADLLEQRDPEYLLKLYSLAVLEILTDTVDMERKDVDSILVAILMNARFQKEYNDANSGLCFGEDYLAGKPFFELIGTIAHELTHNMLPHKLENMGMHELAADLGAITVLDSLGLADAVQVRVERLKKYPEFRQKKLRDPTVGKEHETGRTQLLWIYEAFGSSLEWKKMFIITVKLIESDPKITMPDFIESLVISYALGRVEQPLRTYTGEKEKMIRPQRLEEILKEYKSAGQK